MKQLALYFIIFLCISAAPGFAQSTLPPEIRNSVNRTISQALNAVSIFSSQSTVSSGSFSLKNRGAPASEFKVTRLPHTYAFKGEGDFQPFVDGNIGYFHLVERFPPSEGDGENDFSRISTLSASLGGGINIFPVTSLQITPAFSTTLSHTRNYFDYNNSFSQTHIRPYGKDLFGWKVQTLTYVPSLRGQYEIPVNSNFTFQLWSKYSHLFNHSISTNSATIDIDSDTGLWQSSLSSETPLMFCMLGSPLTLRSFFTRTDIYRSGRAGLGIGGFYEIGLEVSSKVNSAVSFLNELSLEVSYSFAERFDGIRIGLGVVF